MLNWGVKTRTVTFQTEKKKRTPKPRIVRVYDANAHHGIKPKLAMEIHPNGLVYVWESGRRLRRETTVGAIYLGCLRRDVARQPRRRRRV